MQQTIASIWSWKIKVIEHENYKRLSLKLKVGYVGASGVFKHSSRSRFIYSINMRKKNIYIYFNGINYRIFIHKRRTIMEVFIQINYPKE